MTRDAEQLVRSPADALAVLEEYAKGARENVVAYKNNPEEQTYFLRAAQAFEYAARVVQERDGLYELKEKALKELGDFMIAEARSRRERDAAYLDRNLTLALACRMAQAALREDWYARIETDRAEAADSPWRYYVRLQLGDVQLTWHIHEKDRRDIFDFLHEGPNEWDGHTTKEKHERIRELLKRGGMR